MNPCRIPEFIVRGTLHAFAETILTAADTITAWRTFRGNPQENP